MPQSNVKIKKKTVRIERGTKMKRWREKEIYIYIYFTIVIRKCLGHEKILDKYEQLTGRILI